MSQEISAGIIIYRKTPDGPKFLFLYHGKGHWSFPKGHIEEGERSFRAALREVREETGINSKDLRFKEWFKIHDKFFLWRDGRKIFKIVTLYLAETFTSRVVVSHEHQGYGWFLYKEAIKTVKYPGIKNALKKAYDFISSKGSSGGQADSARQSHNVRRYRPGNRPAAGGESGGAGA